MRVPSGWSHPAVVQILHRFSSESLILMTRPRARSCLIGCRLFGRTRGNGEAVCRLSSGPIHQRTAWIAECYRGQFVAASFGVQNSVHWVRPNLAQTIDDVVRCASY